MDTLACFNDDHVCAPKYKAGTGEGNEYYWIAHLEAPRESSEAILPKRLGNIEIVHSCWKRRRRPAHIGRASGLLRRFHQSSGYQEDAQSSLLRSVSGGDPLGRASSRDSVHRLRGWLFRCLSGADDVCASTVEASEDGSNGEPLWPGVAAMLP